MGSLARMVGLCLGIAGALGAAPAMAQKSADTLRVAWRDAIPNVDPYFNSLRTGLIVEHQAWDGLTYRDPDGFVIKPALATSWKWVDPVTLEFELRQGVKFGNGDPFTAADVVYTIGMITDPKSGVSVPSNFNWIAGAEAIDDHACAHQAQEAVPRPRSNTSPSSCRSSPRPIARRWARRATPRRRSASGHTASRRSTASTRSTWCGTRTTTPTARRAAPPIGRLVIKEVADASTELTSLLSGQADWIWQYSPDQFDKLNSVPTIKAMRGASMRIILLDIDAAGRSGADNPLTKLKVRQAIFYAIDREKIAKELVQGGAIVPDGPCYPTQFGCDTAAEVHYDYDPAKAKQLLAEAGYPNGFDTELVHAIVPQWAAAVQNYLNAVGIRTRLTTMQAGAAVQRWEEGKTPLYAQQLGLLFDQRRLGDHAVFLQRQRG